MAKAKLAKSDNRKPPTVACAVMNGDEERRWPTLAGHLTQTTWEDGSVRVTSTLLFFCEEEGMKVCLHDRANGMVLFRTSSGLLSALDELEDALNSDDPGWRRKRLAYGS